MASSNQGPASNSAQPLLSGGVRSNPSARRFLFRNAGQDTLVTLQEARSYFQLGYAILDPTTRIPVDIDAVPITAYAQEDAAFERQNREVEEEVQKQAADSRFRLWACFRTDMLILLAEEAKSGENGGDKRNGGPNGFNGFKGCRCVHWEFAN
ncbi:hypothetical protein BDV95DRAFT_9134 [Massariosphaeria phaeospora]|uniref:Uncharacterized protein n=1 Tax=Massariosphaeria phaeospora TaxID=100035 RepID=A0A7C8IJH6_9PLEO|nr:hypothetical protein BDV95DRAFT_9134 [Massariosphaeria phaeospora]